MNSIKEYLYRLCVFLTRPIFPVPLKVIHDTEHQINLHLDCPLCEESKEWPFPADRKNQFGYHYKLGLHWKLEKGHPQYELHKKLNYHYA